MLELLYRIEDHPTKREIDEINQYEMKPTRLNPHLSKIFSQMLTISLVDALINRSEFAGLNTF